MIVSFLVAILRLTIPALVESNFALCTEGKGRGGMGDVSSTLHRDLGFEWRPIQKSSLLSTLCKNMKKCRTFVKHAVKANLVSPDDLVTLFYDHVPLNTTASSFSPHWTALISPTNEEAFIQIPASEKECTRQSLTGLLDVCEAIGCKLVYVAVKKSCEEYKEFIQDFVSAGFQLVPAHKLQMEGYSFLGYYL